MLIKRLEMSGLSDDIIYALFIITSVGVGPVIRKFFTDPQTRRWVSSLIGFILLAMVCGGHIAHLIVTIVGNCILINLFSGSSTTKKGR